MSFKRTQRWLPTLLFVAAGAASFGASAQIQLKSSSGGILGSSTVTTPHVQAELIAQAPDGIGSGKPLWLGLQITHQPEWHTYWKNPGDSGLPTQIEWKLPEGIDAGEIAWPVPHKIPLGTLANYGYEGTVLLPVPMTVASTFNPGPLAKDATFQVNATWLVCRKECIPEEGTFTLQVPVQGTTALNSAAFDAAAKAHPQNLSADASAKGSVKVDGDAINVRVAGLPGELKGKTLAFFPETEAVIETAAEIEQQWDGDVWSARVPLSKQRSESPSPMPVVLASDGKGWRAELPVDGGWPKTAAAATISPALEAALKANAQLGGDAEAAFSATPTAVTPAPAGIWLAALFGALLGGLILNLMPCVFPVLAIKVIGFAQHSQDRRAHRVSGLAYTAGVIVSFLALGGLMLGLRAAGEAVGWGFQLQSPGVVAALAALFTVIGLNLAGMFEFRSLLPSSVASLQARHPVADSFLTGVLAVAVASPCTAPFMGASLGLTATLPALQALTIFAALGLGLALPYLLASWIPAVARAMPRPGAWMDTLRRLMAFPMFATVVWLVWVLGQQSGINGAAALLGLLVALAMTIWALFSLQGTSRRILAPISLLVLAVMLWTWAPRVTQMLPEPSAVAAESGGTGDAQSWRAWQSGLPEQLVAQGQPVFVDFTAAWCVTCQYNKTTTLADADLIRDFADKKVALLRADWTRRDPQITAALRELGRSGVPVYVLYAPGKAPVVLTELLSKSEVQSALAAL
ncbi:protein-disulfide reductase DsbD family protein [Diaphorobacter caeni]|uniref:protein-disulfide reductase DsbD family protein n=1 Tax=Diaphorobacter caeni TaxID=2784387 RepID=UPI00188DD994|nr:protein-disulfide reductase DsbD domain-containing protein [Diaphorobacter caeni]MBF5007532.1 thioredoxin family protein [Diaphorobacter caeni]